MVPHERKGFELLMASWVLRPVFFTPSRCTLDERFGYCLSAKEVFGAKTRPKKSLCNPEIACYHVTVERTSNEEEDRMLTSEQVKFIRDNVSDRVFYVDRLIDYLNMHETVGIEVYGFVERKLFKTSEGMEGVIPSVLKLEADYEPVYKPISRDLFIHRIPYDFYVNEDYIFSTDENGNEKVQKDILEITYLLNMIEAEPDSFSVHGGRSFTIEEVYEILDFLHLEAGISVKEIFSYLPEAINTTLDTPYPDWFEYIDMCRTLGWTDYMPKKLYIKFNLAREALGRPPIMFPIENFPNTEEFEDELSMFYERTGKVLELMGDFPIDEDGNFVFRWIGVDIKNAESVERGDGDGRYKRMRIILAPNTVVHALIPNDLDEVGYTNPPHGAKMVQIYAGPQTMSFNHKVMKERRNQLGYTQRQVAEAVGSNLRTYQKWENGETMPDGYYLLRILNWLNITNVNDVIIYDGESGIKNISWS